MTTQDLITELIKIYKAKYDRWIYHGNADVAYGIQECISELYAYQVKE